MTDREKTFASMTYASTVGVWLAVLFILSCFLGYQMGADLARKDNRAEAASRFAG